MTRPFIAFASIVASGMLLAPPVRAQQPGQQPQPAAGQATVRTRQNAQTIPLDQHQTPVIAVLYGQQAADTQIIALMTNPDAPQYDKEVIFSRENANKRAVVHEGEQAGQAKRIQIIARRGQEDAQLEKLAEHPGVFVYGVRRPEPKVAQQPPQPQQPAPDAAAQQAAAQQAAAQQDPAKAAEQAAAKQKAAEEEAKRKAAEPKPDVYEAVVTVYVTTGR
jgi:hypothetical protein